MHHTPRGFADDYVILLDTPPFPDLDRRYPAWRESRARHFSRLQSPAASGE